MRRMRVCWAHGAAQGVWNDMTSSAVVGREDVCDSKSSAVEISFRVDIVAWRERVVRLGVGACSYAVLRMDLSEDGAVLPVRFPSTEFRSRESRACTRTITRRY